MKRSNKFLPLINYGIKSDNGNTIDLLKNFTEFQSSIKSAIFQIEDYIRKQSNSISVLKAPDLNMTTPSQMHSRPSSLLINSPLRPSTSTTISSFISQISVENLQRQQIDKKIFEQLKSKTWRTSINGILQELGFKTEQDAIRSLVYFLGLIQIMWNKMLEVELILLFKSEYTVQSPFGKIASKIYPQCFKNRGLSYLNIINKFENMLTNLTNQQKKSLSKVVHDEMRKIKGIKKVMKGKQQEGNKILKENIKALKDYFKEDDQNNFAIQKIEQSVNCTIDYNEKKKWDMHEKQLRQLRLQIQQLYQQINDVQVLHQAQVEKINQIAQQRIDSLEQDHKNSIEQQGYKSQAQLSKLRELLGSTQIQLKNSSNELQQMLKELKIKSEKIEHLQSTRQNQKIFEQSYLKMQQNLTLLTNQKNQTQSDLARWKKDALSLQQKLQKSQKQTQAGIKLAKQVPDIERLKSQLVFLQKEKQIQREVMSAECQNLINQINEFKNVISANTSYIARLEQQTRTRDSQIKILRETLRSFTSCKDMDFDQTFEAVLKAEFDVMKSSFLKQINQLNKINEKQGKEYLSKLRDVQKQKQELQIKISSLSSRVQYFKNAAGGSDSKN